MSGGVARGAGRSKAELKEVEEGGGGRGGAAVMLVILVRRLFDLKVITTR